MATAHAMSTSLQNSYKGNSTIPLHVCTLIYNLAAKDLIMTHLFLLVLLLPTTGMCSS